MKKILHKIVPNFLTHNNKSEWFIKVYNSMYIYIKSIKLQLTVAVFTNDHRLLIVAAVIWPKYCRYGVKHYIINQSISCFHTKAREFYTKQFKYGKFCI